MILIILVVYCWYQELERLEMAAAYFNKIGLVRMSVAELKCVPPIPASQLFVGGIYLFLFRRLLWIYVLWAQIKFNRFGFCYCRTFIWCWWPVSQGCIFARFGVVYEGEFSLIYCYVIWFDFIHLFVLQFILLVFSRLWQLAPLEHCIDSLSYC